MKKVLALVIALLISSSAAFAECVFHIGLAIPSSSLSDSDNNSVNSFGGGFYFDFTRIADAGFTFNVTTSIGPTSISGDYSSSSLSATEYSFGAGFGYSFLHDQKKTLSLTGNFGFDFMTGDDSVSGVKIDYSSVLFYIGPKVSFTYKFLSHFGVFGNVGLYLATGSADTKTSITSKKNDNSISGIIFSTNLGIAIPL